MPSQSAPVTSSSELLRPRTDLVALAARYAAQRRVLVEEVLSPDFAEALRQRLLSWKTWALVTIVGDQHRNFDAAQMEMLAPAKRAELLQQVHAEAHGRLQYLYERYPLLDPEYQQLPNDPLLLQARQLFSSAPLLSLVRQVTGDARISFADGQLTRYRRGHFLTLHDDHADGRNRIAAYVLNLTRDWAADYGGQLQFVDAQGQVSQALVPRFNTLTLFQVPQTHLVSAVAPFVEASRISITGWLRY